MMRGRREPLERAGARRARRRGRAAASSRRAVARPRGAALGRAAERADGLGGVALDAALAVQREQARGSTWSRASPSPAERSTAAACGRLTSTDAALMSCTSSPSVTSKPSPAARAAASSTAVSAAAAAARRIGARQPVWETAAVQERRAAALKMPACLPQLSGSQVLLVTAVLNGVFCVSQGVASQLSHSLALLGDSIDMAADTVTYALAFWIERRKEQGDGEPAAALRRRRAARRVAQRALARRGRGRHHPRVGAAARGRRGRGARRRPEGDLRLRGRQPRRQLVPALAVPRAPARRRRGRRGGGRAVGLVLQPAVAAGRRGPR